MRYPDKPKVDISVRDRVRGSVAGQKQKGTEKKAKNCGAPSGISQIFSEHFSTMTEPKGKL